MISTEYLTSLQTQLYREKQGHDKLSRTFQSTLNVTPGQDQRITTYPDRYWKFLERSAVYHKVPWGRARSYAGDAAVQLPTEHRPKWEPPTMLQKTHKHYGTGANPYPRGVPIAQYYDLTQLKKSNLRWNDELISRPTTAQVQQSNIVLPFPKESPHTSHMSRQAMFPRPQPYHGYEVSGTTVLPTPPPSRIMNKAMGSFGRREVVCYRSPERLPGSDRFEADIKPVNIENQFFNKHDVISEFNKLHPSHTPTIRLPIQRLRKADWHH
ncbi:predicted protein [Nematostella vectensis]|uniref:Uncharacterized protein n=1 Tax=Nematostella vectensis TaxID=45351 RepID=A7S4H0_NEMVE|nr:uncharacterized protein C7orf31 [Nematostella vectensis]EDO41411.1 predicted protein [Nematostella vectensis]|eukprot:XP_001633474.1 predicted protein [Nematostella vectensis]